MSRGLHVTLVTLSNVALKIDPRCRPDAMNSTEANQTSPIICEVNYVQRGYYYREDHRQRNARIVAAKPAHECKRVPVTIAFID